MRNFQKRNDAPSLDKSQTQDKDVLDHINNEIDFEELTQEDRFYLIQQLENMQQNIRYQLGGSPFIFQDFEEEEDNEGGALIEVDDFSPRFNENCKDRLRLEIINDEDEEEDKDSSVQQMQTSLNMFEAASPIIKHYR